MFACLFVLIQSQVCSEVGHSGHSSKFIILSHLRRSKSLVFFVFDFFVFLVSLYFERFVHLTIQLSKSGGCLVYFRVHGKHEGTLEIITVCVYTLAALSTKQKPPRTLLLLPLLSGAALCCEMQDSRVFSPLFYLNNHPDLEQVRPAADQI